MSKITITFDIGGWTRGKTMAPVQICLVRGSINGKGFWRTEAMIKDSEIEPNTMVEVLKLQRIKGAMAQLVLFAPLSAKEPADDPR